MLRILTLLILLSTTTSAQQTKANTPTGKSQPAKQPGQYINGIYIPKDLDDCLRQFDRNWSDSMKTVFKKTPESHVLRRFDPVKEWLIENWGLYNDSRLSDYFNNFGLFHPEDMASIILICYHRQVLDEELNLQQLIRHYQDYWKLQERSRPDIKGGEKPVEIK